MIAEKPKDKVTFRVRFKKPLEVKTLKEYRISKEQAGQKEKIILKDTEDEILFLQENNLKR